MKPHQTLVLWESAFYPNGQAWIKNHRLNVKPVTHITEALCNVPHYGKIILDITMVASDNEAGFNDQFANRYFTGKLKPWAVFVHFSTQIMYSLFECQLTKQTDSASFISKINIACNKHFPNQTYVDTVQYSRPLIVIAINGWKILLLARKLSRYQQFLFN